MDAEKLSVATRPGQSSTGVFDPEAMLYRKGMPSYSASPVCANATGTAERDGSQKVRGSAIDGRTTRHAGYHVSQRKRKLVEQVFGWMKTVGGLRKLRHRGIALVDWQLTFAATAYNLVRLRNLEARCP